MNVYVCWYGLFSPIMGEIASKYKIKDVTTSHDLRCS